MSTIHTAVADRPRAESATLSRPRDGCHAKAEGPGASARRKCVPHGRAHIRGVAAIRAAAYHFLVAAATEPRAPIGGRSLVTIVIRVLAPFVHVAVHVVQPPGVRLKAPDWRGRGAGAAFVSVEIRMVRVEVRLLRAERVAKCKCRSGSRSGAILPFSFRRQPVLVAVMHRVQLFDEL